MKKDEMKHYKNSFENLNKDTRKLEMNKAKKLINCVNSLHIVSTQTYDTIIIDESDTFFKNWHNNDTLDTHKLTNWTTLIRLLREAKKVILLDAFTSKITIDTIKDIDPQKDMTIFKRHKEVSDLSIEFMMSYAILMSNLIIDVKA